MKNRQQHNAYLLLLMFVMGSVVAPFSHYLYMILGDAYDVSGHHTQEHASHGPQHHGARVLVADATIDHLTCDYWSLFATFTTTTPTTTQVAPVFFRAVVLVEYYPTASSSNEPLTCHLRGPPGHFSI